MFILIKTRGGEPDFVNIHRDLSMCPLIPKAKQAMLFISAIGANFVSYGVENMKCYFPVGLHKSLNCQEEIQTGTVSRTTNILTFGAYKVILVLLRYFLMVRERHNTSLHKPLAHFLCYPQSGPPTLGINVNVLSTLVIMEL